MEVGFLAIFIGVIATLATGYAYFRSSAVKVWEQNSEAYRARVELLEEANADLKKQLGWMEQRIHELEARPDWTQVVSLMKLSEDNIVAAVKVLRDEATIQHKEAINEALRAARESRGA